MTESYILGIDLATTSTKCIILTSEGRVIAESSVPNITFQPNAIWSEQDPNQWWASCINIIKAALDKALVSPREIKVVGVTGQMCTLVLLDKDNQVLRPAILWNDRRSQSECEEMLSMSDEVDWQNITGSLPSPGMTAPKIIWVKKHEPEVFNNVRKILLPKDFIRYCLTGKINTEKSDASGTSLFDINNEDWSQVVINSLGISPEFLPPIANGLDIVGTISTTASKITGIPYGTPVIAGGSDQATQAVGIGLIEPRMTGVILGTSGNIFTTIAHPIIDTKSRVRLYSHCIPGLWYLLGITISAGESLRWWCENFNSAEKIVADSLGVDEYRLINDEAARIPPGCECLIFLPYLSGVRTPHLDPSARAAFVGITANHTRATFSRSVMEGVAFSLRDSLETMYELGIKVGDTLYASGGGTKSKLWREIISNVLQKKLLISPIAQGAALGVALMAGTAIKLWPDLATAHEQTANCSEQISPTPELVEKYSNLYTIYRPLYEALKPTFHRLFELYE